MTRVGGGATARSLMRMISVSALTPHRKLPDGSPVTAHFFSRLGDDRWGTGWKVALCGLVLLAGVLWG